MKYEHPRRLQLQRARAQDSYRRQARVRIADEIFIWRFRSSLLESEPCATDGMP